jgi:hypothetical protein
MVKHMLGTRWPDDAMTLCAVCTMHKEKRSVCFLVKPQNQGRWFVIGLASKPLGRFVSGLSSKPLQWYVSGLVRRSKGWVTLYAVCTMHKEKRSTIFLVEPQNKGRRFVSGFASKPLGRFVSGLVSKPLGRFVSGLSSKPLGLFVSGLTSKPVGRFLPV